ncbi:Spt20 family-domain-containing protein [Phlyctochytrium arcticum]|nr:Spt20 family-domain-containing protein [Phlyctochytrium arcticum]
MSLIPSQEAAAAPPPALILHLYPTHFTMNEYDTTYQYNGPLKEFLESVNRQELPTNAVNLFRDSDFHDGHIHVQVRDYRVNFHANTQVSEKGQGKEVLSSPTDTSTMSTAVPYIRCLVLRPTPASLWADICNMHTLINPSAPPVMDETALEVEAKVLLATQEPLTLDADPALARTANLKALNDAKYRIARKRPRNWAAKEADDEKKRESDKMMLIMDERRKTEFHPKFNKFLFIEDWRKRKALYDADVLLTIHDKRHIKVPKKSSPDSRFDLNSDVGNIARTMTFQKLYEHLGVTIYTILNVHSIGDGQFTCTLRWGEKRGTALGKGNLRGNTLRFPLGNAPMAHLYLQHFKSHYQLNNMLIEDLDASMQQPATPIAQRPVTTAMPTMSQMPINQQKPLTSVPMTGNHPALTLNQGIMRGAAVPKPKVRPSPQIVKGRGITK